MKDANELLQMSQQLMEIKLIVDFECYCVNKKYYFKEISFLNMENKLIANFFIKTRKFKDSTTRWLIKNYHQIPCNYGDINYSFIKKYFFNNNLITFYVNGINKVQILSKFTSNKIVDLNTVSNIQNLEDPINIINCQFNNHHNNKHCAFFKVQKLGQICDFSKITLV